MAGTLIAIGGLVALLAIVALLLVRRSERIPGTCVCRRCGFDLAPLLNDPRVATTFACPECGRSTTGFRDTRNRIAPNRVLRAVTTLALSFGVLCAIAGIGMQALSGNQNRWKPIWLLRTELLGNSPAVQTAAANELISRVAAGGVSKATFDRMFDDIARQQRDPKTQWNGSWADLVRAADTAGLMSANQLATFARYGTRYALKTRPRLRVGDPIPLRFVEDSDRSMRGPSSVPLVRRLQYVETRVGDDTPMIHGFLAESSPWDNGTRSTAFLGPKAPSTGFLAVIGILKVEIALRGTNTPLEAWEERLLVSADCVAVDEPLLEINDDRTLTDSIHSAIKIRRLERRQPNDPYIQIYTQWITPPVNIAAEVFLRCTSSTGQNIEERLGYLIIRSGTQENHSELASLRIDFPCDTVDLVLRPSVRVAEREIEIRSIWLGPDLVYPNIPIIK